MENKKVILLTRFNDFMVCDEKQIRVIMELMFTLNISS
jgi:hypothetical protein